MAGRPAVQQNQGGPPPEIFRWSFSPSSAKKCVRDCGIMGKRRLSQALSKSNYNRLLDLGSLMTLQIIHYANGVSAIDSGYVRHRHAAIHIIVSGGRVALVDTGTNDSLPRVQAALRANATDGSQRRFRHPDTSIWIMPVALGC